MYKIIFETSSDIMKFTTFDEAIKRNDAKKRFTFGTSFNFCHSHLQWIWEIFVDIIMIITQNKYCVQNLIKYKTWGNHAETTVLFPSSL